MDDRRSTLPSRYDPAEVEEQIYDFWREGGYFRVEVDEERRPYTIMMPPPNVTDDLHVGHALNNTLQDVLIRKHRMQGLNALWQPGTDHAGIATQRMVERHLMRQRGVRRQELGRDAFLEETWRWKDTYERNIIRQLEKLGASPDWSRLRFTMDEGLSRAVREVFVRLYEKDLIYRGDYLINWCTDCRTALSDIEVEHAERDGSLYYVRYQVAGRDETFLVATTRPETILGDTAVAVHPEDDRYRHLVGETAVIPLVNRKVPIIADDFVDPDFGTGLIKVTPGHDPNDFEMGERADLPIVMVIGEDGIMTGEAGEYAGLDRSEARERVIADLGDLGILEKIEEHRHAVGMCYRCDCVVEPLVSRQWFVRMKPLAAPAIDAVRDGRIRFVPERFGRVYLNWMQNIRDWCISRQLWWGHQIPAWYCVDCDELVVAREAPGCCPACDGERMERDPDVLDTWFSSALWPFSTQGWPDDTPEMGYFFPTDVLVTGWDIIFFWVARMIFSSLEFTGEIPFGDVLIHGLVLDSQGRKMSKSLGNGIDPIEVVDAYGADALRFCLLFGNAPGNEMRFHWDKAEAGRNFANKLWNACRFVLMNLGDDIERSPLQEAVELEDRWLLTRLGELTERVDAYLDRYQLGEALREIYDFAWSEYCDWYIELAKTRINGEDHRSRRSARVMLRTGMETILRLLHPFMPFVTEKLWQALSLAGDALIASRWPRARDYSGDVDARDQMTELMEIIRCVRNLRSEVNVPPSQTVDICMVASDADRSLISSMEHQVRQLARVQQITFLDPEGPRPRQALAGVAGDIGVFLPLRGVVDLQREISRLEANLEDTVQQAQRSRSKLANPSFVEKAPPDIVARERERLDDLESQARHLERRLEEISP